MNAITTKHNLDFEAAPWERNESIALFKIGTCHGQWFNGGQLGPGYYIISIINESPGNGHLEDVFEWFEYSCKRDGVPLYILEFFNPRFKKHCIKKRGFKVVPLGDRNNLVKTFK